MIDEKYQNIYKVAKSYGIKSNDKLALVKKLIDYENSTKPFRDKHIKFMKDYPFFVLYELEIPQMHMKDIRGTCATEIHQYINNILVFIMYNCENMYKLEEPEKIVEHIRFLIDSNDLIYGQSFLIFSTENNYKTLHENRLALIDSGIIPDDNYSKDIFGTIHYYYDLHKEYVKNILG